MSGVMNIFTSIFSVFTPIFWAIIQIIVAFIVASIAKKYLIKALQKLKAEEFLSKTGVQDVETKSSIDFFGQLAYIIVFLLFVPSILSNLGIRDLSSPIYSIVNEFIYYIPRIVIAGIILFLGVKIAKVIRQLTVSLLVKTKVDALQEKAGFSKNNLKLSGILSEIVYVIIIVVFSIEALSSLDLAILASVGNTVLLYLPAVIGAVIIMSVALFLSGWTKELILKKNPVAKCSAKLAQIAILTIAIFMSLSHLGIAASIVNSAFTIILFGVSLAFALAVGLGSKDFVQSALKKAENKNNMQNMKHKIEEAGSKIAEAFDK